MRRCRPSASWTGCPSRPAIVQVGAPGVIGTTKKSMDVLGKFPSRGTKRRQLAFVRADGQTRLPVLGWQPLYSAWGYQWQQEADFDRMHLTHRRSSSPWGSFPRPGVELLRHPMPTSASMIRATSHTLLQPTSTVRDRPWASTLSFE